MEALCDGCRIFVQKMATMSTAMLEMEEPLSQRKLSRSCVFCSWLNDEFRTILAKGLGTHAKAHLSMYSEEIASSRHRQPTLLSVRIDCKNPEGWNSGVAGGIYDIYAPPSN